MGMAINCRKGVASFGLFASSVCVCANLSLPMTMPSCTSQFAKTTFYYWQDLLTHKRHSVPDMVTYLTPVMLFEAVFMCEIRYRYTVRISWLGVEYFTTIEAIVTREYPKVSRLSR